LGNDELKKVKSLQPVHSIDFVKEKILHKQINRIQIAYIQIKNKPMKNHIQLSTKSAKKT